MKKNKPVEVSINEEVVEKDGKETVLHQLFIGKKLIGEVSEIKPSKFEVKSEGIIIGLTKTMELGYQEVLKNWNLHH